MRILQMLEDLGFFKSDYKETFPLHIWDMKLRLH